MRTVLPTTFFEKVILDICKSP